MTSTTGYHSLAEHNPDVELTLIRHGESIWNAEHRYQGQQGPGLSPLGHQQAAHAAEFLEREFKPFDLVLASDLPRVQETAQPWIKLTGRTPITDPRWREIDAGAWSGLFREDVQDRFADEYLTFRRGEDVARGGGESFAMFRRRVVDAMTELVLHAARDIAARPAQVLIFTHGGCIEMCSAEALGLPPMKHTWLRPVINCSVTRLGYTVGNGELTAMSLLDYNLSTQPIE